MARNGTERITWVRRSVLDYRIPVFKALDAMVGGRLSLVYSRDHTPTRVQDKLAETLGDRAIGLAGEKNMGSSVSGGFANRGVSLVYQPGVLKQIRQTAPEVLIGDGFSSWTSFALLYKLCNRLPLVVCYERTFHTERNVQWYRLAYRRSVLKFIDAMCCNGIQSLEYTRSLGMPLSKITAPNMVADTHALGLASAAVTPEEKTETRRSWNAHGFVFLYVGNLIPRKGLQHLLQAWALLERAYEEKATLVLVGHGSEKTLLQQQADSLGLRNVRFAGAVDYDNLSGCYASADVFVVPTLEDNWSLVVPEAMACGLPVLCSKFNGCWPELVHPDRNGWIFDPLDINDLFHCLKRCLERRSRLPEMGQNSKDIVSDFTPQIAADSILRAVQIAHESRN
ncbi:MAG: glycosyltransferase family 4 protein [Acidobacteria bacterium]|nr:glycosyltransferase family 4 protein [Acidobacteriota bacterium]